MKISQLQQPKLTEQQRSDIRLVMKHLGIENTTRNYRKYDKIFDWSSMAENIRHPNFDVLCNIVYMGQKCGRILVNVEAPDRAAARQRIISEKKYISYSPVPE